MHAIARHSLLGALLSSAALAAPVTSTYPVDGPDDTVAIASAAFAGATATADSFEDRIEVRDVFENIIRTVDRTQLQALMPWMNLDGGQDGPSALGFSASGRLLFIAVHDDTTPGDGLPSDAVVRLDVSSGQLTLFVRLELFNSGDTFPHLAIAHNKAFVFVGTSASGIRVYNGNRNATVAVNPLGTWTLPSAGPIRGITIDRDALTIFASTDTAVFRAAIPASAATAPTWTQIAADSDIRSLAWAEHFGGGANAGLYVLSGNGAGSRIGFVPTAAAYGASIVAPTTYATTGGVWHDIAATARGSIAIAADEDGLLLTDTTDTRLTFDQWIGDEFAQVTAFSKGLISPDGEPPGWVIDADVLPSWSRFHPATPDGAAWVVLMLIMSDHLYGDAEALPLARAVLTRYAGLAPDGIKPVRSADGIMKHWINPATGNTEAGWPDEYATLSTMKITVAAARAMQHWPDDPEIARAASRIIFLTKNWDAYLQSGTDAIAFKGLAGGGPDTSLWARPFNEGIIFAEQAGTYGGAAALASSARWFNRSLWPTAFTISTRPITSANPGQFDSAFLSVYPALLSAPFRADPAWRTQIENIFWSNAAWTDDNGPRYFTVFSAGTNPNGYNADSLSSRPFNMTTFTSLMGLGAFGETTAAAGAYHAYRKGARQTFKTGASILYRRSDTNRTYDPNSAGLPDVADGALALAELIRPGAIDEVLARPYPTTEVCPSNLDADAAIDIDDLYQAESALTDLNGDGVASSRDRNCLRAWLRRHESTDINAP